MDKIAKVPHLQEELDWLDQTYGVEKEGFFHQEHWQLLVAIMLSAQSTDKQVDEVLPELMRVLPKDHWNRINFQLIYHGRSICTARKAKCSECGLQAWCEKRVEKKQA